MDLMELMELRELRELRESWLPSLDGGGWGRVKSSGFLLHPRLPRVGAGVAWARSAHPTVGDCLGLTPRTQI